MEKCNGFINEEKLASCYYQYIDIPKENILNPNYANNSLNLMELIEGLKLSELEACIIYYEENLIGLLFNDYIPVSKKDKQEYSNVLFMLSGLLAKMRIVRDKKYNELTNNEKKEHLINTFQTQMSHIIEGRLRK